MRFARLVCLANSMWTFHTDRSIYFASRRRLDGAVQLREKPYERNDESVGPVVRSGRCDELRARLTGRSSERQSIGRQHYS